MEMVSGGSIAGVSVVALGMVLTPGPNMLYLASRSISQGRRAGLTSLGGVAVGFVCYLGAAAAGLSALFAAVPAAYDAVKLAGALYLAWLAWGMLRPGGRSPFETQKLDAHSPRRLFAMGLVTNLLNPKIALMYAALIPQFIRPSDGSAWQQFLQLGFTQIVVAVTVNALIVMVAASLAGYLARHPRVLRAQRVGSGTVLGFFAAKMAISRAP
jgi:threonine/homoserine/homoserine lactone efflux protein